MGGAKPIGRRWTREQRQRAGYAIRLIQTHGLAHPMLDVKHIRGKLWEIRAGSQRIFYAVDPRGVVWLLHAYEKHTQRAPQREIEIALGRMRDVFG